MAMRRDAMQCIGVELKPDALEKYPPRPREVVTHLHVDGSVVDQ